MDFTTFVLCSRFLHADPQKAPFLPAKAVGALARYSFNLLVIPLIYTTIAQSVTPSSLGTYWFVVVAAVVVTAIAFVAATLLYYYHCGTCCGDGGGNTKKMEWWRCIRSTSTTATSDHRHAKTSTQQQQQQQRDFNALRVGIAFPNIVALPILIFPSLCEYPVVYQQAIQLMITANNNNSSDTSASASASVQQCVTQSNAMIFCYFFVWTLLFYGVGYPFLLPPSRKHDTSHTNHHQRDIPNNESTAETIETIKKIQSADDDNGNAANTDSTSAHSKDVERAPVNTLLDNSPRDEPSSCISSGVTPRSIPPAITSSTKNCLENADDCDHDDHKDDWAPFWKFVRDITWGSPGMMAMFLGFVTACIPPIRHAMFDAGGCLYFLGSALETLGQAATPVSTMVVAASLVPSPQEEAAMVVAPVDMVLDNEDDGSFIEKEEGFQTTSHPQQQQQRARQRRRRNISVPVEHAEETSEYFESPVMSDPNFGPPQYQPQQLRQPQAAPDRLRRSQLLLTAIRRSSIRLSTTLRTTPEMRRLHTWFILTRLVVTPSLVVALLAGLQLSGLLDSVPNLAKLVVIVNSALPGALIVVVILQASLPTNNGGTTTQTADRSSLQLNIDGTHYADDDMDKEEEEEQSQIQTAAVVTKVYLTSYLLSIIAISAWTALGLWIILPKNA